MTREEAIKELEERVQITEHFDGSYVDSVDIEALRMAVSALQQPEVMTCRECYHYPNEFADCPLIGWPRNENDFCSKAEGK